MSCGCKKKKIETKVIMGVPEPTPEPTPIKQIKKEQ